MDVLRCFNVRIIITAYCLSLSVCSDDYCMIWTSKSRFNMSLNQVWYLCHGVCFISDLINLIGVSDNISVVLRRWNASYKLIIIFVFNIVEESQLNYFDGWFWFNHINIDIIVIMNSYLTSVWVRYHSDIRQWII